MSFWLIVGRNLLVCVVSLSSWSIFRFCLCRLWPVLSHVPVYVFLSCAFFVGLKVRWKQKILVNNLYLLSVITPFRYPPPPPCAKNHWPAKGGKNLVLTLDYWSCMKIIKFSLFVWRSTNTSSPTDNTSTSISVVSAVISFSFGQTECLWKTQSPPPPAGFMWKLINK